MRRGPEQVQISNPQRVEVKEEAKSSPSLMNTLRADADDNAADQTNARGSMSRRRRHRTRSRSQGGGTRRRRTRRRSHRSKSERRQQSPVPDSPAVPLGPGGKGPDPPSGSPRSGAGPALLTGGSVSALLIHIGQALAQERGQ